MIKMPAMNIPTISGSSFFKSIDKNLGSQSGSTKVPNAKKAQQQMKQQRQAEAKRIQRERDRQREANRNRPKGYSEKREARQEELKTRSIVRKLQDAGSSVKYANDVEWMTDIKDERERKKKEAMLMESVRAQGYFTFYSTSSGNGWVEGQNSKKVEINVDAAEDLGYTEQEIWDMWK